MSLTAPQAAFGVGVNPGDDSTTNCDISAWGFGVSSVYGQVRTNSDVQGAAIILRGSAKDLVLMPVLTPTDLQSI